MNKEITIEKILEYLRESKPRGINEIIDDVGLSKKMKKEYKEIMEELETSGNVIMVKGDKYTLTENMGYLTGKLEIVKGRYGFVDTETTSYFILESNMRDAISGDTVLIKCTVEGDSSRKPEAEIIKVLKRETTRVVGTFRKNENFGFVIPFQNLGKDVYIAAKYFGRAKDNDIVVVEMLDWGNSVKKPEGRIVEIIGSTEDTKTLINALIIKYNYSETFSDEINREILKISDRVDASEIKKRTDLRDLSIITIDGDDAKDYDDAVYAEKLPNGNHRLIVSIADVSHYVPQGSAIDAEAENRGNSIYLVDRVIPMFPKELSNGICSLNEKVDRLTISVDMEIDGRGKAIASNFYRSVINSKHRMTYKNVNKMIAGDEAVIEKYADIKEMITTMKELANIIREKRKKRGCIDFDLSETKVVLDENGDVARIEERERGDSEKLIEDFMIEANEAVAEKLFWVEMPMIYRIHEQPDIEKLKVLNEFLSKFDHRIHKLDEMHPGKIQKVMEAMKDKEYKMLLNKMILMSLKQAKYSLENRGHFGLASQYYTHFTSPIRRYPDLVAHRVLLESMNPEINNKRLKKLSNYIEKVAAHSSSTERKAMEAEEESIKIKICGYMKDKVGEIYESVVVGLNRGGMYLESKEGIEFYLSIFELKGEYVFDEKMYKILEKNSNKEYNIADKVLVKVVRVSMKDLTIEVVPYIPKGEKDVASIK